MEHQLALSILNSLNSRIAVIDPAGNIVMVNDAWARFAHNSGDLGGETTGVGVNYLDAVRRAYEAGDESAGAALTGIEQVITGQRRNFEWKYPCHSPDVEQWFLMRVTPLAGGGGAVISHIDITAQHLAAQARARHALTAAGERQNAREERMLAGMDSGSTANSLTAESVLSEQYHTLLSEAIERRALKMGQKGSGATRAFALALARQTAGPRDLVRIHTQVITQASAEVPRQKRTVIMEEGRLLLLEVMGSLTGVYRDMVLADLELKNM